MAGEDYSVGTKVTADVSNFEKGMNKAEKALKDFSDKLANSINRLGKKGLIGSVANVTLAMQGLTQSFNTVIKFAKNVSNAINECTEAYKGQVIAERALDTAIANNPFISGESSKALLQFASDMQKVTNYGDDELIPMMTNLVSLGRTESEVMQIMSVAMDMSAGMGISLDTAITQLNATLNGNIGRLGQQNAELKNLTEEELKQGKAIEILGEKFKGLSSATADTSKQLQNIKGDFKEALGQFTLPSSDMWNKFWAGFYERGIEVINKLNAFIDAQTIGRKIAKEVKEQMDLIPESNIKGRTEYARKVIQALSDEELKALGKYLEGSSGYLDIILDHSRKTREEVIAQEEAVNNIANTLQNKLGDSQFRILRNVAEEMEVRRINTREAKAQAEAKAEQTKAEELATSQLKEQEKIEAKKTDWASKLLDQRIEMLETERDRAMQLAEEEGQETYTIWRDYNNKILELKLERLEKEKEKALAEEGLNANDKIKIEEFYSSETKKIYDDLGQYKKKKDKEEKKEVKNKLKDMLKLVGNYAKEVSKVLNKITKVVKTVLNTIKNLAVSGKNILLKMFDFNIDEALDAILVFEDKILTFFVETLPKMPNFVKSVVQSVKTLLKTLKNIVKREDIANYLYSMIKTIGDNLPEMMADLLSLLTDLFGGALDGLLAWLNEDGLATLLGVILQIQKALENFVADNLAKIADLLEAHIDDFANFLAESLASANRLLPKLTESLLKIILALIEAITKAFENEDFINSFVESIEQTTDAIMKMLPKLIGSFIRMIFAIINALVPKLPEIILYIVNAVVSAIPEILGEIVSALADVISSIFEKIFTLDFWIDMLSNFGEALGKTLSGGFTSLFGGGSSSSGGGGSSDREWYKKVFDPLDLLWHANGTNNAQAGLSIVGEAGPELVRFRGGEQVLNSHNTQKALEGMSGTTINQNVTFNNLQDTTAYAMMNQFKQYNRSLAINGVI
jgi:phage-related protein